MACFLVPTAEAVITTVATKVMESKEKEEIRLNGSHSDKEVSEKISFSRKLRWLSNLLWGGSLLLAFEHLWHGEVVPWFPFLTAAADKADAAEMLHEMATVGVCMALLITLVWVGMVFVVSVFEKRNAAESIESHKEEVVL